MADNDPNFPGAEFQKALIIICIGCICICLIILGVYNSPDVVVPYLLTFDGSLTFSDGKIAIEKINDDSITSKSILLYGIDNISETKINASDLTSGTSETLINSSKLILSNPAINTQVRADGQTPYEFTLSIKDKIIPGIYKGWLFVTDSNGSSHVPISVSTEPRIAESILIVIIGVLVAIIIREMLKLYTMIRRMPSTITLIIYCISS
jgi:hypothetical protein